MQCEIISILIKYLTRISLSQHEGEREAGESALTVCALTVCMCSLCVCVLLVCVYVCVCVMACKRLSGRAISAHRFELPPQSRKVARQVDKS